MLFYDYNITCLWLSGKDLWHPKQMQSTGSISSKGSNGKIWRKDLAKCGAETKVSPQTLHSTGSSQYLLLHWGQIYPPVDNLHALVSSKWQRHIDGSSDWFFWGNPILTRDDSVNPAMGGGSTCSWTRSWKWVSSKITLKFPPVDLLRALHALTSAASDITEQRTFWLFSS